MNKDEVINKMRRSSTMTMEELFAFYREFVLHTENTPMHMNIYKVSHYNQRALHAAMGLMTESAEVLDEFKKHLYGKQRPLTREAFVEEAGDLLYYYTLFMDALGIDFRQIMLDNVTKLANRYIERFEV